MIDWNHPELTKEAVVRTYAKGCTYKFEGDRGRFILREARGERRGEIIAAGMSISEMWDAAYALPEIAAYVAAHRTQEAKPDGKDFMGVVYTQEAPAEAQEQHACDCWIRERQVCDICQGVSPGPTQPTHSAAERERAAGHIICERDAEIVQLTLALDDANARIAEARYLIEEFENLRAGRTKLFPDFHAVTEWLRQTKGTPDAR